MGNLVPFGIDSGGVLRTAYEVPRGSLCACNCPGCGAALLARQGEKLVWHFAHAAGSAAAGPRCGETAIHKAGKAVLSASVGKVLFVPSVQSHNIGPLRGQFKCRLICCPTEVSLPIIGRQVDAFAEVEFYRRSWPERGILAATTPPQRLIVEIAVTNPKALDYSESLIGAKLSAVEITLSPDRVFAELEKGRGGVDSALKRLVLGPLNENRRWLHFEPSDVFQ